MLRSKSTEKTGGTAVISRASRDTQTHKQLFPRTLASAVFIALASLSASVDAAGLGRLSVQSGLGQPLRAEVEVTSLTKEEAQSLSARLAPPDAFRQAGLEFNQALNALRFAIEPRSGRTFVRITSTQPINEPFVDLLVELNWATGKFVREYTFLLDPPEMRGAREPVEGGTSRSEPVVQAAAPAASAPARVAAPAPVAAAPAAPAASASAAPAPAAPAAERPAPAAAPAAARSPAPERARAADTAAGAVTVRRGDTLGNIARGALPAGVNLDQAMIAIYRANPDAFINKNMNLVREGARLDIPDSSTMGAIDAGEARREVRIQSADFNAYRQRLAGAPRMVDAPRPGQTAAGAVGGGVQDNSAAAAGDQLRLSKPGAGAAAAGAAAVGSQASRGAAPVEDGVARATALKEANSRIADLEKNVTDLQKLLEMKNRSMADLQKQLDDAKASSKAVTGQVGATTLPAPLVPAEPVKPAAPPAPVAEAPKAEPPKAEPPVAAAPAPTPVPAPPAADAPKPPVASAPPTEEAPGIFDDLLENPFLLPGLGGIALLGAGYGWYAMRRRRKVEKFEDSLIAADAFTANSLFGSTGGQSVDTSNSVFSAGATGTAVDVHSTEVDPIAEADVYIAYGREAQAEEILKEALKRQPERQAIRLKLLEIYAGRKDTRAFETVARDMHDMASGQNEEWPKAVTLGLSIDPSNPLYGGSSGMGGAAAAGAAAAAAGAAFVASRDDLDFPELAIGSFDPQTKAQTGRGQADTIDMPPAAAESSDEIAGLDFDLNIDTRIDRAAAQADARIDDLSGGTPADLSASLGDRFELPSLDLDIPALESLTQGGSPQGGNAAALDLSPISLDLEPATVGADEGEAGAGGAGRWQEMATKLDLASAYEEIGDKEGARELLQEVIKGGDSGQQQKARAMLSKIG
jgi:pilus assembly protein FimV